MWTNRNKLILIMLLGSNMLNYADRQIIALLKPMLQHQLHWTDADYGQLTALFQLASALAFLGSGWVVDRIGWRRANPLSVGAWSLVAMTQAFARTLSQFSLARIVLGSTEAFCTPTTIKTIAAVFRNEDRSLALGFMNAAGAPAAFVTPIIIPWLALRIGWENSFLVTGGVGLIWVAVWYMCSLGKVPVEARNRAPAKRTEVRWSVVLRDKRTWTVAGAKVLSDQIFWLFMFWTPDLFHTVFHLSMAEYGTPIGIISAVMAVGGLIGGWVPRHLMQRGVSLNAARKGSLLGAALLVTPVWMVLVVHNYWIATALLCLMMAAHQAFSVNVFALAADISPVSTVATVIGICAFFGNLAGAALLQIAGWELGAGYGYAPLLALASVSYLLGVVWVQVLLPRIVATAPEEGSELA